MRDDPCPVLFKLRLYRHYFQTSRSSDERWSGVWPGLHPVGAGWVPGAGLALCVRHYRQGAPQLGQDHLVHCTLPLLCDGHPAGARPHPRGGRGGAPLLHHPQVGDAAQGPDLD